MHILRIIIILSAMALFFSCKSHGPLSPEESFNSLKAALKSDTGNIESLLSGRSIEKIRAIISMISNMNDSQLDALGDKFGMDAGKLKNLSIKDYLSIQVLIGNNSGGGILKEIGRNNILGVDIKDNQATVRLENGMELFFVKEGGYWKFDMEELSAP